MPVTHILLQNMSDEWYTPAVYIKAVLEVLGEIDLDPASNAVANQTVQAKLYYDVTTDGLTKEWRGKCFVNPPYGRVHGKNGQYVWSQYLINQYNKSITTEAILLVNASIGNKWFKPLWRYPICLTDHRIRFHNDHKTVHSPTSSNAFVYFGSQPEKFDKVFHGRFGHVILPRTIEGGNICT